MKKKAFNFTSKALFVLKMFKFLSWLFSHVAKRLHQKDKVNFEIYDVIAWLSNNCKTYIAQYLRRKGNQTMKFARLIEYNMTNIFLEKSYTKCGGESSPRPFFEKLKLSISLDQQPELLYVLFLLYTKTLQTTCFYPILSFFLKKERSRTSLPTSFPARLLKNNTHLVIF